MFYKFLNRSKKAQKTEILNTQLKSKQPQSLRMKAYLVSTLVCLIFIAGVTYGATVINVPGDQPTIQAGIDAAANGDTVSVAAGVYNEVLIWQSKAIALVGAGAEVTIVDASGLDSRCLTMIDVPETARVEGFTFTGGLAIDGGGIHLQSSSPTLSNNIIKLNSAWVTPTGKGGGLYLENSSPLLNDNVITQNSTSHSGGGMFLLNSSPHLMNNNIGNNSADKWGGGIYLHSSNPVLTNNIIEGNIAKLPKAWASGGGMYLYYSNPILTDNTIIGNHCQTGGGGGLALEYSSPTLTNNIITENIAHGAGGGGLQAKHIHPDHTLPLLQYNIITANRGTYGNGLWLGYNYNATLAVSSPYPQPCNPEVWIPYTIGRGVKVTVEIYKANGKLVRVLDIGYQKAGAYISRDKAAHWDGRNEYGEKISSGIYFYTLKAGDFITTKKLVVLR